MDKEYGLTRDPSKFKLANPEYFNFAWNIVDKQAENNPNKVALITIQDDVETHQNITFADLRRESNKSANAFRRMGLKRGDRVVVMVGLQVEWYYAVLGLMKLGVIYLPTTAMSTPKDIEYRVSESGAVGVLCASAHVSVVEQVKDKCSNLKHFIILNGEKPGWVLYDNLVKNESDQLSESQVGKTRGDDILVIFFTSGTTGLAKMVRHTQNYALSQYTTAVFAHNVFENDIHWTVADSGWAKMAYGSLFGQWIVGCTVIQYQYNKIQPDKVFKVLEKFRVNSFCAPPTLYRMLVKDPNIRMFPFLRSCTSAGEPLNPEAIALWAQHTGHVIREFYGQSETPLIVGNMPGAKIKPGSMGLPSPGYDVQLVDPDEISVITKVGEEGVISVRVKPYHPPGIFIDYWKRALSTQEAFKGDWYLTGDKAYKDEEGYLWFVGRNDDVFKSSGYRIGPFEVESAIVEHKDVLEAAVIGVPDATRGEVPKAFVVLVAGCKPSDALTKEIQEHVIKTTAPYKYPRYIEYVAELPKTVSGKIRRNELRNAERRQAKL